MTRLVMPIAILFIGLLAACSPTDTSEEAGQHYQGYAEARLLYLAPRTLGPLTSVMVEEGDQVASGAPLFSLDDGTAKARLEQAEAALSAARARLADLRAGGRKENIAAARQGVAQARAALKLAQDNYARSKELVAKGQAPQSRLDRDTAALSQTQAALRAEEARLALIRAPARKDAIAAAAEEVRRQKALVAQSAKALNDLQVVAPTAGSVQSLIRRVGEIAGPSQPVLALLPPAQLRIRFFIPERKLGAIQVGQRVKLTCDGCDEARQGRIIFIAQGAEFTPPVIFTEKERQKLVFMAEVLPDDPTRFHPGQPVLVVLP
ncbi:MAG: HlyD family efflux transporter periplasmic adaptor subunit [Robiginitomaculum sp.]|nr:HlyD family efflux transporter periplasmic adaptor subunit [Robiginitomaculum sp.]MDQ7077721.1 HlyD family efflux transporter periplasmic adaptor subunit [Robiginitomaculum sp.]